MLTPVEFMTKYRRIKVKATIEDEEERVSRPKTYKVKLKKYFMMNWAEGSSQRRAFNAVSRGARHDRWFNANKQRIRSAAMGKGAPKDYELALEWAVRSGRIETVNQGTLQRYFDDNLGIDCSGFVTNYLAAVGLKTYSTELVRNTGAASYFRLDNAINDAGAIKQGDLLVWMSGNSVKRRPGHIAVVESFVPQSNVGGNIRVVEATGSRGAAPKLLDSMYTVERIIDKRRSLAVMVLVVKRHGRSGSRVAVMRMKGT